MPNKNVKLLFYCTKAKPELFNTDKGFVLSDFGVGSYFKNVVKLNGKVVAEAECDLVEKINLKGYDTYCTSKLNQDQLLKKSCLSWGDLAQYFFLSLDNERYAIYPKNVKPLDEPRKLNYYGLKKAPQNMCFKRYPVPYRTKLNGWEISKDTIIISIKSKHLFKILKGEKTIEVRKSILNALKELI